MYRVGIIGLGSIAARYSNPSDPHPYCHTGGIRQCETTNLVAVADLSEDRKTEFKETWEPSFPDRSINYYDTDIEMLENEDLDIIAVCVRGPYHFAVMQNVLKTNVKAIFLEKPAGCSLEEIDQMTTAADENKIPIIVDYSRHWAPHLLRLQELVAEGLVGQVKSVIGYCPGTILSFAIHNTDMICQFAGYDPMSVSAHINQNNGQVPEGYEQEPSIIGSIINFKSGIQGFHVGEHGTKSAFSVDVLGTEGQLRTGYSRSITTLYDKDNKLVDNTKLDLPPNQSVFKIAYQQIVNYLEGGNLPHCTQEHYIAVNEIGFASIESGLTGQTIEIPCQKRSRLIYANG